MASGFGDGGSGNDGDSFAFDCFANKAKAKQAAKPPPTHTLAQHTHTRTLAAPQCFLRVSFFASPSNWNVRKKEEKYVATFFEGGFSFCMLHDLELYSPLRIPVRVCGSLLVCVCVCVSIFFTIFIICKFMRGGIFVTQSVVVFVVAAVDVVAVVDVAVVVVVVVSLSHSAHRFSVFIVERFFYVDWPLCGISFSAGFSLFALVDRLHDAPCIYNIYMCVCVCGT